MNSDINFTRDELDQFVKKIKIYFSTELDQEIDSFDAEFLIDFFAKEIGPQLYNKGLSDAHALFKEKADEVGYLIEELEKLPR